MNKSEFISRLRAALLNRGVPADKADAYLTNLQKYLSPEDVANATDSEIEESADVCAKHLLKRESAAPADDTADTDIPAESNINLADEHDGGSADDPTPASAEDDAQAEAQATKAFERVHTDDGDGAADAPDDPQESMPTKQIPRVDKIPRTDPDKEKRDKAVHDGAAFNPIPDPGMYGEGHKSTPRGIAMLTLITVVSSPLWLIAAVLFFAPFIAMFVAEFAVTAALVCLLAGGAAAGAAASLTGIVYGIVQMFSSSAVGLYEIGFGVIIGGITMICGILIYNGAVRFMPWVIRKTGVLFKFAISKVKPLIKEYRRRCEKL